MAKEIVWLEHATQNLIDREIPIVEVQQTIENPSWREQSYGERTILMRLYYDAALDQEMLLRVVVDQSSESFLVITVYKTSKFKRYTGRDK